MPAHANPLNWPLSIKVPLVVGGLMILLGAVVSNAVLVQLSEVQGQNLHNLSEAYLNGVSTAVQPHVLRGDAWETFDVLDRAHDQYENVRVKNTIVALADGAILAGSDPVRFPVDGTVPAEIAERFGDQENLIIEEGLGSAWVVRNLVEGNQLVGRIYSEVDISKQLEVRRITLWTMAVVTMLMTILLAGLGYGLVRWMLSPLSILGEHVVKIADGEISVISERDMPSRKGELQLLMTQFNAMARALREREALAERLAEEEKLSMLGKLASGMAHEVNNPLGGMGNAIDTIRKHGGDESIRNRSLDIIERGLVGIASVAKATLATYKGSDTPEYLSHSDIEDLKFLIRHKVNRRNIDLKWINQVSGQLPLNTTMTRQIILNLLLNACEASPRGGVIHFCADVSSGALEVQLRDYGVGIPEYVASQLKGAEFSGLPANGRGLGAWTVGRLLQRMGGKMEIETLSGEGTKISVRLPLRSDMGEDRASA